MMENIFKTAAKTNDGLSSAPPQKICSLQSVDAHRQGNDTWVGFKLCQLKNE